MLAGKRFFYVKAMAISIVVSLVILAAVLVSPQSARATPGSGVILQLLSQGNLSAPVEVEVNVKGGAKSELDVTKLQAYKITLPPGAYTGWHQHGGPHLIIVDAGTLTNYHSDKKGCTRTDYPAGSAILDPGFESHFARNEGSVDTVTYVSQMLPDQGIFRIDIPDPGNCSGILK